MNAAGIVDGIRRPLNHGRCEMYVQMNCVIVDADNANREELAASWSASGSCPSPSFPTLNRWLGS